MAHLSPSAIFSPSVARLQQVTARDWNYIDGWLNAKFNGRSAPPFERNSDTLKALLALAGLNESADEDCELLSRVDAKCSQELQRKEAVDGDGDGETLKAIEAHLTREGHASLDALASTGVALNEPFAETERLARKMVDLQITSFNLEQASDRVAVLHGHLGQELERITALLEELQGDAYRPSPDLPKQTLDRQRRTKVLAAKLPDLKNRIASLTAAAGSPKSTIEDVKVEEEKYKSMMATVKDLEAQVKSYHGLPHDTDLARLEVGGLRVELKKLTRLRDGMFEGLVERESPQKSRS